MVSATVNRIGAGERIVTYTAGGGGIRVNYERPVEAVWQDVRDELISVAVAEREYGLIIDPETLEVDQQATRRRREQSSRDYSPAA